MRRERERDRRASPRAVAARRERQRNLHDQVRRRCFSPLYAAVGGDDLEAVKALLDAGATADAPSAKYGLAPLFKVKSRAVGEALLDHGAKIGVRNKDGQTPFQYLTVRINPRFPAAQAKPVATLLLEHGADINARDAGGSTPLIGAVILDQPDYATFLLRHRADPNLTGKTGETVLVTLIKLEPGVVPELAEEYKKLETLLRAHGAKQ